MHQMGNEFISAKRRAAQWNKGKSASPITTSPAPRQMLPHLRGRARTADRACGTLQTRALRQPVRHLHLPSRESIQARSATRYAAARGATLFTVVAADPADHRNMSAQHGENRTSSAGRQDPAPSARGSAQPPPAAAPWRICPLPGHTNSERTLLQCPEFAAAIRPHSHANLICQPTASSY